MSTQKSSSTAVTDSRALICASLTFRSGLLGLVFLLPILFTLGDLTTILGSVTGQPVPEMYLEATGSDGAAFGLFFIGEHATSYARERRSDISVLINGLVCGLACSQAASRCIWA